MQTTADRNTQSRREGKGNCVELRSMAVCLCVWQNGKFKFNFFPSVELCCRLLVSITLIVTSSGSFIWIFFFSPCRELFFFQFTPADTKRHIFLPSRLLLEWFIYLGGALEFVQVGRVVRGIKNSSNNHSALPCKTSKAMDKQDKQIKSVST